MGFKDMCQHHKWISLQYQRKNVSIDPFWGSLGFGPRQGVQGRFLGLLHIAHRHMLMTCPVQCKGHQMNWHQEGPNTENSDAGCLDWDMCGTYFWPDLKNGGFCMLSEKS